MAKQKCTRARILFVDDEMNIRLTLPRVLAGFGFDFVSVGTVNDALAKIRNEHFDILVSDLNLPEPNAGFTVIEEMRKVQPRSINFVLTGYPAEETFHRAKDHGVAHYFVKPVEIQEIVKTMKKRLTARDSK